jgi:multidrug resistance efflux pump
MNTKEKERMAKINHDLANLQREIKEQKQKLEKDEWRIGELSSFLEALIKASNAKSLIRAGLFKRPTGDYKKQALETCGLKC